MAKGVSGFNFEKMERSTRTVALVGAYLQSWAVMELQVDEAIGKILKLSILQEVVLSSNLAFHNKIHILGTLLHLTPLSENEIRKYKRTTNQMLSYATDRNIIAHNIFAQSNSNDGVQFIASSARGELKFPAYDWPISKFEECIRNFQRCSDTIREIGRVVQVIDPSAISSFLTAPTEPSGGILGIGSLGLALPQALVGHTQDMSSASDQTESQNPPPQKE